MFDAAAHAHRILAILEAGDMMTNNNVYRCEYPGGWVGEEFADTDTACTISTTSPDYFVQKDIGGTTMLFCPAHAEMDNRLSVINEFSLIPEDGDHLFSEEASVMTMLVLKLEAEVEARSQHKAKSIEDPEKIASEAFVDDLATIVKTANSLEREIALNWYKGEGDYEELDPDSEMLLPYYTMSVTPFVLTDMQKREIRLALKRAKVPRK